MGKTLCIKNTWLKRSVFTWLIAVCFLAAVLISVRAQADSSSEVYLVEDGAGLFTSVQKADLMEQAGSLAAETGWDIMAVTTSVSEDAQTYAEDFFIEHNSSEDGVVCLIDMDNRELYLATSGIAIDYVTDERLEKILDDAYEQASEGDYYAAMSVMLEDLGRYFSQGIPAGHVRYDEETGEITHYEEERPLITSGMLLISAALGIAAAAGIVMTVSGTYRMKLGKYTYDWRKNSRTNFRRSEDRFVTRHVTRRRIPKSPPPGSGSGGGRSTTHTGSGGHTFGGGGRKF